MRSLILKKTSAYLSAGILASSLLVPFANSCSRVLWDSGQGVFVGRTQDWTEKVDSTFRSFPRGINRTAAVSDNPIKWTSKYGSLVLIGYDSGTHEGVNEKGLSAHILYLAADNANFGERDTSRPAILIMQWAQYYLDNFASVAEAVADIKKDAFQIVPITLSNGKPTMFHLSLEDASGDSAVIEYINGKPVVHHDKRYTVMTNEPTFDQQIANLKQYRNFGGDKPLPGERTPTDRFVRAAYYTSVLPKPENKDVGAAYILSVMRNVSVPFGAADPDKPNVSNTLFRSVKDLTSQRYFFESTYAPNIVWIDYGKLDYQKGAPETTLAVEKEIFSLSGDVTSKLTPTKPFVFGKN